jgi:hypothetical protein
MMSKMWKTGTLVAIALAATATVAAQQPPPQQPPAQQPPAASAPSSADKVVVTGCIQRGLQSPIGTTGAAGAAAAADSKFILTKASPASDATATPKTYRLDAEDSQLTAHVNHKVEITGTLDAAAKPAAGEAAAPAKLKVASVKMVAASCE